MATSLRALSIALVIAMLHSSQALPMDRGKGMISRSRGGVTEYIPVDVEASEAGRGGSHRYSRQNSSGRGTTEGIPLAIRGPEPPNGRGPGESSGNKIKKVKRIEDHYEEYQHLTPAEANAKKLQHLRYMRYNYEQNGHDTSELDKQIAALEAELE